jgi:hypothetical protein
MNAESQRAPSGKTRKTAARPAKDWRPENPMHGRGTLQQIVDWVEFEQARGIPMTLSGAIAADFQLYLRWLEDPERNPHPIDLPTGAPRDFPEPPRRPC